MKELSCPRAVGPGVTPDQRQALSSRQPRTLGGYDPSFTAGAIRSRQITGPTARRGSFSNRHHIAGVRSTTMMLVPFTYRAAVTPHSPFEKSYPTRSVSRSARAAWSWRSPLYLGGKRLRTVRLAVHREGHAARVLHLLGRVEHLDGQQVPHIVVVEDHSRLVFVLSATTPSRSVTVRVSISRLYSTFM
jgi:hypothetical protein